MQELHRVLNMPQYGWIYLNRTWICLNMSGFTIIEFTLQVHEYLLRDGHIQKLVKDLIIYVAFDYFRKTFHLKSLRGFWICVGFWICQGSEYSTIVNMPGFWISRVTQGLPIFCKYNRVLNMLRDAIIEGFWIFHIPNMPGFCAYEGYTRFWIFLNMA